MTDVLRSALLAIPLGVTLSALYYIPLFPIKAICKFSKIVSRAHSARQSKGRAPNALRALLNAGREIYNCIFTLLVFICVSLFSYITLDGVIRLLPLALTLFSFAITKCALRKFSDKMNLSQRRHNDRKDIK